MNRINNILNHINYSCNDNIDNNDNIKINNVSNHGPRLSGKVAIITGAGSGMYVHPIFCY